MDLLPTLAALTESKLPSDRKIDGIDLSAMLTGDTPSKRTEFVYYSAHGATDGILAGEWKLLLNVKSPTNKEGRETNLFHLTEDLSESRNLAAENPETVAKLKARLEELDAEITNNARPVWKRK